MKDLIVMRGGGDIASGIAYRLIRSGFAVIILESEKATMVRRTVSFGQAIYDRQINIEGIEGVLVDTPSKALDIMDHNTIPVLIDPYGKSLNQLKPTCLVDGILAKKNLGTHKNMAPITIGVGPGFTAGVDVDAVVETMRGHYLGRVILEGQALANTGIPGPIGGYTTERVLRSPIDGVVKPVSKIGDMVEKGQLVLMVGKQPVYATITGVLRGLLQEGLEVTKGLKIGDIDPRAETKHCYSISDKALSVGGGVLEALLHLICKRGERLC